MFLFQKETGGAAQIRWLRKPELQSCVEVSFFFKCTVLENQMEWKVATWLHAPATLLLPFLDLWHRYPSVVAKLVLKLTFLMVMSSNSAKNKKSYEFWSCPV